MIFRCRILPAHENAWHIFYADSIFSLFNHLHSHSNFVGKELNICVSSNQCSEVEVDNIDVDAATGLLDVFKDDLSEGFGLDYDMDCKVKSVQKVASLLTDSTNSTNTTVFLANSTNSTDP